MPQHYLWPGASIEDSLRDNSFGEVVDRLKELDDPEVWDAFFQHMDSVLTENDKAPEKAPANDEVLAKMKRIRELAFRAAQNMRRR